MYSDGFKKVFQLNEKDMSMSLQKMYENENARLNNSQSESHQVQYPSLIDLYIDLRKQYLYDMGKNEELLKTSKKGKPPIPASIEFDYDFFHARIPKKGYSAEYEISYFMYLFHAILSKEPKVNSVNQIISSIKTAQAETIKASKAFLSDSQAQPKANQMPFYISSDIYNNIYQLLRLKDDAPDEKIKELLARLTDAVQKHLNSLSELEMYTENDFDALAFYTKIIAFSLAVESRKEVTCFFVTDEPLAYLSYCIGESFLNKSDDKAATGLYIAKYGLNINNPEERQDAFNNVGLLAIAAQGCLQLAYDTYYSWIHQESVGLIKHLYPDDSPLKSEREAKWRTTINGSIGQSTMHTNLSYTCSCIADTYERRSARQKLFNQIALEEIKLAIELDSSTPSDLNTWGSILSNVAGEKSYFTYNQALEKFIKFEEKTRGSDKLADQTLAYTKICNMLITILALKFMKYIKSISLKFKDGEPVTVSDSDFSKWLKEEKVKSYIDKLKDVRFPNISTSKKNNISEKDSIDIEEALILKKQLAALFKNRGQLSVINLVLLLVHRIASEIRRQLRQVEYSTVKYYTRIDENDRPEKIERKKQTIAYYTTLSTSKYLFDDLYKGQNEKIPHAPRNDEERKNSKNCLTIFHPKYMNDPNEGLPLLNAISTDIKRSIKNDSLFPEGSTEKFRETFYKDKYVFLKSFTNQIDKLIMWNRYASNYETDGNNSNGCCIQFDQRMFDHILRLQVRENAANHDTDDDYHLYRVVYVSEDGTINPNNNPILPANFNSWYLALKALILLLNDLLSGESDLEKARARASLMDSLQFIMFLFKDADYADENESRLIFTRDKSQQDSIKLIPGNPDRISIALYSQTYINRIILGPNVRKKEEWKLYYQYQLNHLRENYDHATIDEEQEPDEPFIIEESSIHYHT